MIHLRRKGRRRVVIGLIIGVVLAILALGLTKCQGDSSPPKAQAGQQEQIPGGIPIGKGAIATGQTASRLKATLPTSVPRISPALQRHTGVYSVTPSGKLPKPVMLYLPTFSQPKAGQKVFLASAESLDSKWEISEAKVVERNGKFYIAGEVSHLSFKFGFSFVTDKLKEILQEVVGQMIQEVTGGLILYAPQPICNNPGKALERRYKLYSSKDVLLGCLGYLDGEAQIKLTNPKPYPVVVRMQQTRFRVVKKGARQLSMAGFTKGFDNANRVTLFPGDEMTLAASLQPGSQAIMRTEFDGFAQNLYRLDVAVRSLLKLLDIVELKGNGRRALDVMQWLQRSKECVNSISEANAVRVFRNCLTREFLVKIFGPLHLYISIILLAEESLAWIGGEITSGIDSVLGKDKAQLTLVRRPAPAPDFKPYVGDWYEHESNIGITANGKGIIQWEYFEGSERKIHKAEFQLYYQGTQLLARITSSTQQGEGTANNGYYSFRVGEVLKVNLAPGHETLTLASTSTGQPAISGCNRDKIDCGA